MRNLIGKFANLAMMDLGGPSVQIGLHHFLPRRPTEDPRKKDLRRFQGNLVSLPRSAS